MAETAGSEAAKEVVIDKHNRKLLYFKQFSFNHYF